MKQIYALFLLLALASTSLVSCNKNDDYDKYLDLQEQEKQRIKEQIALQKPLLAEYAKQHFENAKLDSNTGIWFEVLSPGDNNSYSYAYNTEGLIFPNIKVAFKGELLNGTVFEEATVTTPKIFGLKSRIPAWQFAFFPYKIGEYTIAGLTTTGLKKGSKIRFITNSIYGYDQLTSIEKVPANSPLIFTIEVLDISNNQISNSQ